LDDETLLDFGRNPDGTCRQLSHSVRANGAYQFSDLRAVLVPKGDSKDRVICIPTVRDRVFQRALNDYLANGDRCGLNNKSSFGFIPGRSVEKAAARARELRRTLPWAYKTDISSFFDAIDRQLLAERIRRQVRDRSLHKCLIAASECEIKATSASNAKRIAKAGIQAGRGVRQGMPLSPFFANLILKDFDRLIEYADINMVRYADDLICFAGSQNACEDIHGHVRESLAREKLQIPDPGSNSKTQIYAPD
jgi:retron-type reverse transcriptase